MNGDLSGRAALLTGASIGMGFASARALGQRGARVMIAGRNEEKLAAALAKLQGEGIDAAAHACDIRSVESLQKLVAAAQARLGTIDILVANGGGPPAKPALEIEEADWEAAFPLIFLFVPRLCRLVVPQMRERNWGRIVAINSVSTRQPIPGLALSNTLRPAVVGYLKTLSQEIAADRVTVNSVLPGYTRTDRQEELARAASARTGKSREEILNAWAENAAAKRLAEPEEIAEVIAFLCSPGASYLTGQAITVDGGYVKGLL